MKQNNLNSKNILVVDDEADLREIVASELEFMGAKVFTAENVSRAQRILEENKIDLVISDIRMPGGTGIDLLQHIKSEYSIFLPVILITGFADITNEGAYALGAEALIHKPFKLDELLQTTEKLCLSPMERFERSFRETGRSVNAAEQVILGRGGVALELSNRIDHYEVGQCIDLNIPSLKGNGVVRWVKGGSEYNHSTWIGVELTALEDLEKLNKNTLSYIPSANTH